MKGFNDVDIKDLYPLRFAAERFAGANLTSFPPMGDPEYGKGKYNMYESPQNKG